MMIRTKWHHIRPLVDADEVYVSAPKDGRALPWDSCNPNKELFRGFLDTIEPLPRFVIDPDLITLAQKDEYTKSLYDMKKAGVLRLPYPGLIIEFSGGGAHSICILRDLHHKEQLPWEANLPQTDDDMDFHGMRMSVERDSEGNYLVVSPSWSYMGLVEDEQGAQVVKMLAQGSELIPSSPAMEALVANTYIKDCGVVFYAAAAAYLLMATAGVAKEVVNTDRINRKRQHYGKPLIPRHTYVHIGRVYRSANSDTSDKYEPRRSPIPHWRRGHLKNVRYGAGREFTKAKYIYPKLVAYHGGFEPKRPDYLVTK